MPAYDWRARYGNGPLQPEALIESAPDPINSVCKVNPLLGDCEL